MAGDQRLSEAWLWDVRREWNWLLKWNRCKLEQEPHQDQNRGFSKCVSGSTPSAGWESSECNKKGSGGQAMLERQNEMKLSRLLHHGVPEASRTGQGAYDSLRSLLYVFKVFYWHMADLYQFRYTVK